MELCELTQLFKRLPGQSLFTGYFSPLGSNPSGRQKEEVVVCLPGPGCCHDCPDLRGHRACQPPETSCPRRAALQALMPGCKGRLFYRFFLASFLGLLFAEGAVALGFLITSALRGSDGSASCVVTERRVLIRQIKPDTSGMASCLKGLCKREQRNQGSNHHRGDLGVLCSGTVPREQVKDKGGGLRGGAAFGVSQAWGAMKLPQFQPSDLVGNPLPLSAPRLTHLWDGNSDAHLAGLM